MNEVYYNGWPANQPVTPGASTVTQPWTYTYWPQFAPQTMPQPMANGWKCGDCQTVMAPWMPSHKCTPATVTNTTLTGPTTATASTMTVLNKAGDTESENT